MKDESDSNISNQTVVMPHIEDNIPLPKTAREALPEMTPDEELTMRAHTIKVISDIQDEAIEPSDDEMETAETIAKEKMKDLNAFDIKEATKIICGSARSMGIEVKE